MTGQTVPSDVAALLDRLVAHAGVDVLGVVVVVVGVDPVAAPPRVVLREARVAREQRVGRDAGGVVVEPVVVGVDRVARRAGVAERVVVAAVVADLDRVAGDLEVRVVTVEVGGRAGVDARVAVVVVVRALDEAVVGGEGEDAVLVVAAGDEILEPEPVGLQDVDRVELGLLGGEVADQDAAGAVGADGVEPLELVVDRDVGPLRARADDLQSAELAVAGDRVVAGRLVTEDRDQVEVAGTAALVGVRRATGSFSFSASASRPSASGRSPGSEMLPM